MRVRARPSLVSNRWTRTNRNGVWVVRHNNLSLKQAVLTGCKYGAVGLDGQQNLQGKLLRPPMVEEEVRARGGLYHPNPPVSSKQ
jgi:hypothetical protein